VTVIEVSNGSGAWLGLWLEPLGEDRWLHPGETFRVRSDYTGDESAFSIEAWSDDLSRAIGIENVNVWVLHGLLDGGSYGLGGSANRVRPSTTRRGRPTVGGSGRSSADECHRTTGSGNAAELAERAHRSVGAVSPRSMNQ
jgi:hypothetical protein